jgi:hypothetical protein
MASFSSGGGLFIWPIGLAQLLLQRLYGGPGEKPGPGAFVAWSGAGTLTWALFFSGYHLPPAGFAYLLHNPVQTVRYASTMIGSPLSWHQPTAQSLGVILLALGVWAVFRLLRATRDLEAAAPLLALVAFTLLNVVADCSRREGAYGIQMALASRYCSFTMLGLVALYALLVKFTLTERRPAALLVWGGMAAFLASGAMTNFICWREDPAAQARLDGFVLGTYAVRYAGVVSDEAIAPVYPWDPSIVRERTPFLRARGYSLFHQTVPLGLPARYNGNARGCNIEAVNGRTGSVIDVHQGSDHLGLRVTGWAVDAGAKQAPSRAFVSIDGQIDVPALFGPARPDMSRGASGFISYVRTSLIPDGEHALELKIVSHDGAGYWTCGASHIRVAE